MSWVDCAKTRKKRATTLEPQTLLPVHREFWEFSFSFFIYFIWKIMFISSTAVISVEEDFFVEIESLLLAGLITISKGWKASNGLHAIRQKTGDNILSQIHRNSTLGKGKAITSNSAETKIVRREKTTSKESSDWVVDFYNQRLLQWVMWNYPQPVHMVTD